MRYGGDEFVIVVPDCDRTTAETRAAALQQVIDGFSIDITTARLRTGISVGVGACPEDGSSMAALLAVADQRMYVNKRHRRARLSRTDTDASKAS